MATNFYQAKHRGEAFSKSLLGSKANWHIFTNVFHVTGYTSCLYNEICQDQEKENDHNYIQDMRKIIATINMTLDGFCDHTATGAVDEILQHYNELLNSADTLLYGRITYQLMETYWPSVVKSPTGNKAMDEFAVSIDNISKLVYSRTLKNVDWKNTELKNEINKEELLKLKQQEGRDILAGSPGLIVRLMQLDLIDEYQLCVHPVVLGSGLPLFKNIKEKINLKLLKTKVFECGAVVLYYKPAKE
ncbi:MAG: dihydrofolate reductase family protein [Flavisolibacter sp.]